MAHASLSKRRMDRISKYTTPHGTGLAKDLTLAPRIASQTHLDILCLGTIKVLHDLVDSRLVLGDKVVQSLIGSVVGEFALDKLQRQLEMAYITFKRVQRYWCGGRHL